MSRPLVIVESPAKAKTIAKLLGSDYVVLASVGHIADLPKSGLQVDVENDFVPNYEITERGGKVLRELKESPIDSLRFSGAQLGQLVALVDANTISSSAAKEVFAEMMTNGGNPQMIVEQRGLQQVSNADELRPMIANVIAANADKAAQYRGGKTGLLGFFVGQAMRQIGGKANPQVVQALVQEMLAV